MTVRFADYLPGTKDEVRMTKTFEESITVDVPVETAYEAWTAFEDFPRFMTGVEEVHREGPETLHWQGKVAGRSKEWDARIVEENPGHRVAWESVSGAENNGTVGFEDLGGFRTEVTLRMEIEPETTIEDIAAWLGLIENRVEKDLKNFKAYVEDPGDQGMPDR